MEIKAFEEVVLTADLPNRTFKAGTLGVVVDVLAEGAGYAIEIFAANGQTLGVEVVAANQIAPASDFPFPVKVERAA
jgi:hypothetical protein